MEIVDVLIKQGNEIYREKGRKDIKTCTVGQCTSYARAYCGCSYLSDVKMLAAREVRATFALNLK